MQRVLVTGAAGFIGSHVVDRLLAAGREVVGVDCFTSYYSRARKEANLSAAGFHSGFRLVEGDLLTLDLDGLLCGVDGVAHLAGEPGVRRSWGDNFAKYLERNVSCTQRLLEAASRSGIRKLVHASSSSVYGFSAEGPVCEDHPRRPISPYGLSKLAAEDLVELYGREKSVPATVLRYFTVYGPRQRPEMALSRFVFAALRGGKARILGNGEQSREMTHVSDAVEATLAALDSPVSGIYNVGGGSRTTVNELLALVRRAVGTEIEAIHEPPARGDARSTWANLERAGRDLGYNPQVGLEEGVASQVEWAIGAGIAASSVV